MNGVVLASLLAWLYFVRPTFSVHIVAITITFSFTNEKFSRVTS